MGLAHDVPVLVMCPCWRGATSPHITDFFLKKKKRGCVWDKVATEWAGNEDWICNRMRCHGLEDKKRFVTFAEKRVNLSTIHRTRTGKTRKNNAGQIFVTRPEPHLSFHLMFVQTSFFSCFEHLFDKVSESSSMLHFGSFLSGQNQN